jgi:hypothetical protein
MKSPTSQRLPGMMMNKWLRSRAGSHRKRAPGWIWLEVCGPFRSAKGVSARLALVVVEHVGVDGFANSSAGRTTQSTTEKSAHQRARHTAEGSAQWSGDQTEGGPGFGASECSGGTTGRTGSGSHRAANLAGVVMGGDIRRVAAGACKGLGHFLFLQSVGVRDSVDAKSTDARESSKRLSSWGPVQVHRVMGASEVHLFLEGTMNPIQPAGIASLAGEDCAIRLQEERLVELDCRAVALGGRGNLGAPHGRTSLKKIASTRLAPLPCAGNPTM